MSSSNNDTLTCGNCGYDGGKKHLEEKLEWVKNYSELANKDRSSEETKQNIAVATTVAVVLCTIVIGIVWVCSRPVQPVNAQAVRAQEIAEMYQDCLSASSGMKSEFRATVIEECNRTFKNQAAIGQVSE